MRFTSLCRGDLWERWISEIVSDFWSIARVGVVSTLGLIGVVSLPRPFVFRINVDDPHPTPWIRVKLSCAIGDGLYPHPQWQTSGGASGSPTTRSLISTTSARKLLARLQQSLPEFVATLIDHRPQALRGRSLREAMKVEQRTPGRLAALFERLEQGAEADVSRAAVARVRRARPGESGRRSEPRRRKRSPGEAPHLLGDAQHARYFGLLRGHTEIEGASVSSLDNLGQRRDDNGKIINPPAGRRWKSRPMDL